MTGDGERSSVDSLLQSSGESLDLERLLFLPFGWPEGRVTKRAIELTDCFLVCYNRLILAIVQIRLPWFALISTLVDRVSPCGPPLDGYWANSSMTFIYTGGAGIPDPYL
jgi:hypothetical protein